MDLRWTDKVVGARERVERSGGSTSASNVRRGAERFTEWDVPHEEKARELHRRFQRRRRQQAAWDAEEARDLRAADALRLYEQFGCVTLFEYLEVYCGLDGRSAVERMRVARALAELPLLEAELEAGTFTFSHVRELVRIVVSETEEEWVAYARGMSFREIQQSVSGRKRGDRPTDPTLLDQRKRSFGWQLRPSTIARLQERLSALQAERGERFADDDDLVNALCDALDAGVGDDKAPAQVWLTDAGHAFAYGVELDNDEAAHLLCDADVMGHVDDEHARTVHTVTPRKRKRILARDGNRCRVPGCRHRRHLEVHHVVPREAGGSDEDDNLVSLCSGHHRLHHSGSLVIRRVHDELVFERPGEASLFESYAEDDDARVCERSAIQERARDRSASVALTDDDQRQCTRVHETSSARRASR